MKLLIVTAYCESDAKRCVQLYNWIGTLGGIRNNRVLFVTDRATKHETIVSVCAAAKPVCAGYETMLLDKSPIGSQWPRGANWAFMHASKKVKESYKIPFLWLEPDCSPTKEGWLEALENEYAEAGKPYMGSMMRNKPPLPEVGMWGIAVYDPGVHDVFVQTTMRRMNVAFDVAMAPTIVPQAHDTKLIQCINGPKRVPQRIKPEHVKPDTVLIHQDKWGDVQSILGVERHTIDVNPVSDVTVVITNFKRPYHLRACFKSCMEAKVENIVVSSSAVNDNVRAVHKEIIEKHPATIISGITNDLGCNETWIRGVLLAKTSNVTILHDDDWLLPEYEEVVAGKHSHADIVHWDGDKHVNIKKIAGKYVTRSDLKEGKWPIGFLLPFLLDDRTNTLSPVSGLFPKKHVIDTLTECEREFGGEYFVRPTMMVGNDLLLWLRACEKFKTVYYTHTPRISYGHWNDSESYKDSVTGAMKLLPCYNATRKYWLQRSPKIIHVVSRYTHKDEKALARFREAQASWEVAYSTGLVIQAPLWKPSRNSWSVGDKRMTHYLKDVLRVGLDAATREDDIICLTNDDTIANIFWWFSIYSMLGNSNGLSSFRKDLVATDSVDTELYPNKEIGVRQFGRDAFAFRKSWLARHIEEIPDYLLGYGDWDSTLAILMRLSSGHKSTQAEMTVEHPTSEVSTKFIYHREHPAFWDTAGVIHPGNAYNRGLTNQYLSKHLGWEMPKLKGTW